MKTRSYLSILAVATLVAFSAAPVSADDIDGDQFFVDEDVIIDVGDTVKGNVVIRNGHLFVVGTVEGNITQLGDGFVIVFGGDGEGLVKGNIDERGDGSVVVALGGTVEGNIDSRGDDGNGVVVNLDSLVKGNIEERGDGVVFVFAGSSVEGNIEERNVGNVDIRGSSLVKGNVIERGPGDVFLDGSSTVEGNIE